MSAEAIDTGYGPLRELPDSDPLILSLTEDVPADELRNAATLLGRSTGRRILIAAPGWDIESSQPLVDLIADALEQHGSRALRVEELNAVATAIVHGLARDGSRG